MGVFEAGSERFRIFISRFKMSHGTLIRKIFPGYLARARARARARPSRAGGPPARIRRKCLKIRRWRARTFSGFVLFSRLCRPFVLVVSRSRKMYCFGFQFYVDFQNASGFCVKNNHFERELLQFLN